MKAEKRKNSGLKKLIPAVAMLATSAVMLSTATYAWFTMNKEVKMTGLKMTATTGEGIEISLAALDSNNNITFSGATYDGNHPTDNTSELGWKSSVAVGQYYKTIGKLKPASSEDGKAFYDATDATNKGKTATTFTSVTLGDAAMADLTTYSTLAAENTTVIADDTADSSGYYVDIPVHIRTTKVKSDAESSGELYCKLIIKNATDANASAELYKAIRVAFIPFAGDASSSTKIFGFDDAYYSSQVVGTSGTLTASTGIVNKGSVTDTDTFATNAGMQSGLILPYAEEGGKYGHLDFYVRVWLEGQSESCFDDNAGQSWNIDLAFSLGAFPTT